jgi:hypothetical protein
MKIVDKINDAVKEGRTFFSFEFFPPRTEEVGCCTTMLVHSFGCGRLALGHSQIVSVNALACTASSGGMPQVLPAWDPWVWH